MVRPPSRRGMPRSAARLRALVGVLLVVASSTALGCLPEERPLVIHASCDGTECFCSEPWGDCDGEPANGCETDLTVEPEHCGSCGHDCLRGSCREGRCEPFVVTEPLPSIGAVTAAGDYVYFFESGFGAIARTAIEDGSIELLQSDQLDFWSELVATDERIVWETDLIIQYSQWSMLWEAPAAGGAAEPIAFRPDLKFISPEGALTAWGAALEDGLAVEVALPGEPSPRTLFRTYGDAVEITSVALSGGIVFFATLSRPEGTDPPFLGAGLLYAADPEGDAAVVLGATPGYLIYDIRVAGGHLVWRESDATYDRYRPSSPYRIVATPLGSWQPRVIWQDEQEITGPTTEGATVVWATAGDLYSFELPDGVVDRVASTQEITTLAMTRRAIVWLDVYDNWGPHINRIFALAR